MEDVAAPVSERDEAAPFRNKPLQNTYKRRTKPAFYAVRISASGKKEGGRESLPAA